MSCIRARYVLHQLDTVRSERISDPLEYGRWFCLVVDGVEGGNQVVAGLFPESGRVPDLEADVGRVVLGGLGAGAGDGILGES
jgi:hypothetical protein